MPEPGLESALAAELNKYNLANTIQITVIQVLEHLLNIFELFILVPVNLFQHTNNNES